MSRLPIRILIADPHAITLRGVRCLLESSDRYQITSEALNGREALELALEAMPDIAIVAYSLPGLNGIELAYGIKQISPATEILLFTMHERDGIVAEATKAGILGVVLKSDPESELLAALDAICLRQRFHSSGVSGELLNGCSPSQPLSVLTHREREVVQLISEGRTNKEAALIMGVSTKTIESHRSQAMRKLGLRTVACLVRFAVRNNLVLPEVAVSPD